MPNFTKNCLLLQEMPTSSRKAHFIKNSLLLQKTTFFDKVPFFDEVRFTGTSCMYFHVELEELPLFCELGTLTKSPHFFKKSPLLQKNTSSKKAHFIKKPADVKKTTTRHRIYNPTVSLTLVLFLVILGRRTNQ